MKSLVVYYSWSNGNTEKIAQQVASALGADIEKIDTVKPYPSNYDAAVDQGHREVNEGFEPALKPTQYDPADYDLVVVGTPTWWYTMSPAILSYLHAHEWGGKTVVPFMTNAGWPGTVIKDMEAAVPGATVEASHEFRFDSNGGSKMVTSRKELDAWVQEVTKLAR